MRAAAEAFLLVTLVAAAAGAGDEDPATLVARLRVAGTPERERTARILSAGATAAEAAAVALLAEPDWELRRAGVEALAGSRPDAPLLARAVTDPDHAVARAAARALGLSAPPGALSALAGGLRHPVWSVRAAAVRALAARGDAAALALVREMGADADPDVVTAALLARARSGDASDLPLLLAEAAVRGRAFGREVGRAVARIAPADPALLEPALESAEPFLRVAAAARLLEAPADRGRLVPLLATASLNADFAVRVSARAALACAGPAEVRRILEQARRRGGPDAAPLLALAGAVVGEGAVDELAGLAQGSDPAIATAALHVLGQLRSPRAVPVLVERARRETRDTLRLAALRALTETGRAAPVEPFFRALRDGAAAVRSEAAHTLLVRAPAGWIEALLTMARGTRDLFFVRELVRAAADLGRVEFVTALTTSDRWEVRREAWQRLPAVARGARRLELAREAIRAWQVEPVAEVRLVLVSCAGFLGGEEARGFLLSVLTDPGQALAARRAALARLEAPRPGEERAFLLALARRGEPEELAEDAWMVLLRHAQAGSLAEIEEAWRHPTHAIRRQALTALERLRLSAAVPMLRRIVTDAREEEDLRSVALSALAALRDPALEEFLLGFLRETRVLELRSDAAAALAQLPRGRGVPLLLEALAQARISGDEDGVLVLISALPHAPEPAVAAFLWELLFERRLGPHAPHADLAPRESAVLDALCRLGDEAARRGWEAFASRRAPGEVRAAGELFHFRAAQFFERRRREGLARDAWARVLVTPPRASRKDLLAAQALAAGAEDAGDLAEAARLWEEAARIASLEGYASESATDAPGLFDLERWRALAASARLREAARDGDEAGMGRALEGFLTVAPRRFDLQAETARDLVADGVGLEVARLLAERAVLLAPADPVALDALGAVRLELGGDALDPLDRAALAARLFQETPPRLYLHRAVALARAGRKAEALADLREAFRAEPELRARLREDPEVGELLREAEALEEGR